MGGATGDGDCFGSQLLGLLHGLIQRSPGSSGGIRDQVAPHLGIAHGFVHVPSLASRDFLVLPVCNTAGTGANSPLGCHRLCLDLHQLPTDKPVLLFDGFFGA